jgi:hypothetical protein
MSRSDQRRRRALRAFAPVAGLLAVGLLVWQGSTAAFSATTDNGSESWATGNMTLVNDGGTNVFAASTTPLFTETALKIPSATVTRCLTVKAGGTTGGTLNFYRGAITGTNSATLAPLISLTIKAMPVQAAAPSPAVTTSCTNFNAGTATLVATTNLSAVPTTYVGGLGGIVVPTGTQYVVYQFSYQVQSTGLGNVADNALQSSNAVAPFTFELQ